MGRGGTPPGRRGGGGNGHRAGAGGRRLRRPESPPGPRLAPRVRVAPREREEGKTKRSWWLSEVTLTGVPHGPCAASRALASPRPPAASRVLLLLRSGLCRGPVAVTFLPLRRCRGLLGVREWLFQPFILDLLWGFLSSARSVAGRGQAGLRDFLFLHEPGRRSRCLSWGWGFFPSL